MIIEAIMHFATEPTNNHISLQNTLPSSALDSSSIVSELMKFAPTPIPSTASMLTRLNVMLNGF